MSKNEKSKKLLPKKTKKNVKSRTFPIYWGDRGLGGDYEGCRGMVMVMLVVLMLPLIISLLVAGHVGCIKCCNK